MMWMPQRVRDPLETSGDPLEGGDPLDDIGGRDAQGQRGSRRGEHVVEVVHADERGRHGHLPAGIDDPGLDALLGETVAGDPDDGGRLEPVGDGLHRQLGDELLSPGIVHVDDRGDPLVVQEEELLLRLEIILHGMVVVEVLAAQVREDGDIEADAPDPLLFQRVGGDLHQAMGGAGPDHLGEHPLNVGGLGRRPGRLRPEAGAPVIDGPDDGRDEPARRGGSPRGHRSSSSCPWSR